MPNSTLRELELARDKQLEVSNQLSEQINELREGRLDNKEAYDRVCIDFATSERQYDVINRQIQEIKSADLGSTKTERKLAIEASPSLRFMKAAVKGDGYQGLEAHEIEEQRALVEQGGFENIHRQGDFILPVRALGTGQVGELISTDVMSGVVEKLVNFGGARKVASVISTSGGNPIKVPAADESGQEGELIAENATAAVQSNISPTEHTMNAYTYSSKSLMITKQAIADTGANGFDLVGYQIRQAARRLGRITNKHFTVGTGTNQPQGIVAAAGQHAQIVGTGGISGLAYADLVKLVGSIDSAYLEGGESDPTGSTAESGMTAWMFHQAFETQMMLLTDRADGNGRPLWAPGLQATAESPRMNTILGYPYVVNNSMDGTIATGANKVACVFGNIGGYMKIRQVESILIRQFDDSGTAPTNSVMILGYARADSRYVGHGDTAEAFKKLTTKA